jgi:hypothetical protein
LLDGVSGIGLARFTLFDSSIQLLSRPGKAILEAGDPSRLPSTFAIDKRDQLIIDIFDQATRLLRLPQFVQKLDMSYRSVRPHDINDEHLQRVGFRG